MLAWTRALTRPPTEWCVGNNPYYRWFVGSGG
jgi:hypothetical protein